MERITSYATRFARLPLQVFATVLVLAFGLEAGVMVLLDRVPTSAILPIPVALLDAALLTAAMSPALWFFVVRPLRELLDLRGRLLRRMYEVQEREQARLGRELHDELGQHLTAVLVGLRTVAQASDLAQVRERCGLVTQAATGGLEELRRLARGLRPTVLESFGLATALERLCEEFTAANAFAVQLENNCSLGQRFDGTMEICLFRVVQEALTNVARHAQATQVSVKLELHNTNLKLRIADNGVGFDLAEQMRLPDKFGLDGMRERVALTGGRFELFSRPGAGTTIQIEIPVREGPQHESDAHFDH